MKPLMVSSGSYGCVEFGTLVNILRGFAELSPRQLAEKTGVHVSFIRGIERGAQSPSLETAKAILGVLDSEKVEIVWSLNSEYDLQIKFVGSKTPIYFRFKSEVKGQNHRPDKSPTKELYDLFNSLTDSQRSQVLGYIHAIKGDKC